MPPTLFPRVVRALLLSCALLLVLGPRVSSGFLIRLPSHSEQCFLERANRGDKIAGNVRVVSGGSLDVDVKILDPSNRVVFEQARVKDDTFQFHAPQAGLYAVCFSNGMSVVTSKVVSFNIYVGSALQERDAASAESLSPLELSVQQLTQGMREVRDSNQYERSRERVHHQTANSTHMRVLVWRTIQICSLVAVAAAKVFYIRNLFEKKRGA